MKVEMRRRTRERYRVWIANCADWQARDWQDLPPAATALEPAEGNSFSASEALAYVESFNRSALHRGDSRWAVVVPVRVRYEGDLRRGQSIVPLLPHESRLEW